MPITTSDLQWFNSHLQSWTTPASNGGRFTETVNPSDVKNNVFPDVSAAQRAAGAEHWRKLFIGVRHAGNSTLIDPKISIQQGTPGDSFVLIYPGTQTDTQDELTARPYGYATLTTNATAGATSIAVTTEVDWSGWDAAERPFQDGDLVRIDARDSVLESGDYEYRRVSGVSYSGTALTLTIDALENGYTASEGIHVASVIEPDDIQTRVLGETVTSADGLDYAKPAEGSYITVPNVGGIYQEWTVTVTDAATGDLSVSGGLLGTVATGAMGANLTVNNPSGGTYFTIPATHWTGTAATGDTLTFTTTPAATGVWYQRVVPAGAAAISNDPVDVCIEGESA